MLTEKKIEKNYQKLLATNEKFGFLTEEFLEKYGESYKRAHSFFTTHKFDGGAVLYALTVTKYAVMINSVLPKTKQFEESEVIKMAIMSSLKLPKLDGDEYFEEEVTTALLYRYISTNCSLNESELGFLSNSMTYVATVYALGNIINQARSLTGLEMSLPEKGEEE